MSATALPPLMTEAEAAAQLGVELDTLRRIRRRGEITCWWKGKRPVYTTDHLLAHLQRREKCPAQNPANDASASMASIGSLNDPEERTNARPHPDR